MARPWSEVLVVRASRDRRPRLLIPALLIGAALVFSLLRIQARSRPSGGAVERPEGMEDPTVLPAPGARLVGRARSAPRRDVGASPTGPHAAPSSPPPHAPTTSHEVHVRPTRILDAVGHPVARARVVLSVQRLDGPLQVNLETDEEGRVDLAWPDGKVTSLEVDVSAYGESFEIVVREDDQGVDLTGLDEIPLGDLIYVPVLTVDPWRAPRPGERILFRSRTEGREPGGWWGATSDAEARLTLGPFPRGALLEFRAGPRGLSSDAIMDSRSWQRATADGAEIEVMVTTAPRLRLSFPGLTAPTCVPISVLDMRTDRPAFPPECPKIEDGTWTAPALADDLDAEVVVGPLDDGRFARLEHVRLARAPVEVLLRPGRPLTGRVTALQYVDAWTGQVAAYGRGFTVLRSLDAAGRFAFPGVPDEAFTLVATARPHAAARSLGGLVHRRDEVEVEIPVRALVQVRGTVVEQADGTERPSRRPAVLQATSDDLPTALQPRIRCGSDFALLLLPGRWRLHLRTLGGERDAEIDLGQIREDQDGVVFHLH